MKIELNSDLWEPQPGYEWKECDRYALAADLVQIKFHQVQIHKPPRVLFHRTGEWRAPKRGEFYEAGGPSADPVQCGEINLLLPRWILRREEVPNDG